MNAVFKFVKFYWKVLTCSFTKFSEDDLSTHAAALSYYTIFSLPPMLMIILFTASFFYDDAAVRDLLFSQLGEMVGRRGVDQLISTIDKLQIFKPTLWVTILGIIILLFTSTTVLVTMQNALNNIFRVKAKPKGWGILKMVKDRFLSLTLLISFGFILLVSLTLNAVIAAFGFYLEEWLGGISVIFFLISSLFLPFLIITLLFATIFKFLPDTNLKWRDTWFGAILTSVLFSIGKEGISFYIGNSNVAGLYDAAGSIMVIMVWVFFASLIVLFGAVFTFCRMEQLHEPIEKKEYAVTVEKIEIEGESSVPEDEKEKTDSAREKDKSKSN